MMSVFVIRSHVGPEAVRDVLDKVRCRLAKLGVPHYTMGLTEIVLAETLNNIVEHAYQGCDVAHVTMRIRICPDRLQLRIADRGAPMPNGQPPAGPMPSVDGEVGALPENGFGWPLINMLTGQVGYTRKSNGNVIDLEIPITKDPSAT